MDEEILGLSVRLGEAAARNTAGAIAAKVQALRDRRDAREAVRQLEEIINDLIDDKIELLQIAQAFEQDLVAQRITEEQAAALIEAIVPALTLLAASGGSEEAIDPLLPLLTPEVISALQLLGFNFRKAFGEPLTQLLADYVLSKGTTAVPPNRSQRRK